MVGYRLYFMDEDGHIQRAAELECADDALALQWAKDQSEGQRMELWSGKRRIAAFPAEPTG